MIKSSISHFSPFPSQQMCFVTSQRERESKIQKGIYFLFITVNNFHVWRNIKDIKANKEMAARTAFSAKKSLERYLCADFISIFCYLGGIHLYWTNKSVTPCRNIMLVQRAREIRLLLLLCAMYFPIVKVAIV